MSARDVSQTNFDQSEASILLLVQQSIYYSSSWGQSICNLNLMPHPIILASVPLSVATPGGDDGHRDVGPGVTGRGDM